MIDNLVRIIKFILLIAVALGGAAGLGALSGMDPAVPFILLAVVGALLALVIVYKTGMVTVDNALLVLWMGLVAHRTLVGRTAAADIANTGLGSIMPELIVTTGIFGVALIFALLRLKKGGVLRFYRWQYWLIAYVIFAFVSIAWTSSIPFTGFWMMRLFAAVLLILLYFERAEDPARAGERFLTATLIAQLPPLSLAITAYANGQYNEITQRVGGTWLHHGVASVLAASVGMGFLIIGLQKGRWWMVLTAALCFLSGFFSAGKTGAASIALGFVIMFVFGWTNRGLRTRGLIALLLLTIPALLILPSLQVGLLTHLQFNEGEAGGLDTLYSRYDLWQGGIASWTKSIPSFLVGYGFVSARTRGITSLSGDWTTTHAHNSFITTAYEMGLTGLIILVMMIINTLLAVWKKRHGLNKSAVFPGFVCLVVLILGMFTDAVVGGILQPTFYQFLAVVASVQAMVSERVEITGFRRPWVRPEKAWPKPEKTWRTPPELERKRQREAGEVS